jgi:hypothetical protein
LLAIDEYDVVGSNVDPAIRPQPLACRPAAEAVIQGVVCFAARTIGIEYVLDRAGFPETPYEHGLTVTGSPSRFSLPNWSETRPPAWCEASGRFRVLFDKGIVPIKEFLPIEHPGHLAQGARPMCYHNA